MINNFPERFYKLMLKPVYGNISDVIILLLLLLF